jgi:excisionase family DNA binding protein
MDESSDKKSYLDIKELAAATGLSISTLRRRVRDGSLPAIQLGGKSKVLRFSPRLIAELFAHGTTPPEVSPREADKSDKPLGGVATERPSANKPNALADGLVRPDSGPIPGWMRSPLINKPITPGSKSHD